MARVLVTGATGQIGSELVPALRERLGEDRVIAAGHVTRAGAAVAETGPYVTVDVRDRAALDAIIKEQRVGTIFHLAAILSAVAESEPGLAWDVNMKGLMNVLESARTHTCSVFFPSSIGAFGPTTPSEGTPQDTIQRPGTMYGITKVSGELLCDYYHDRYGVDTRGLRYPGLISHTALPGGGTTDYAVEIFYGALTAKKYTCFLREDTRLDMMYMPDAVRAAIELMGADRARLRHRNAFNITAMTFTPEELGIEIRKHIPDFTLSYEVDPVRQGIADGWPAHLDDRAAREEWDWRPQYDLPAMVHSMLRNLSARLWEGGDPEPF